MISTCRSAPAQLRGSFLSHAARPLRFAGTGGAAGTVQLSLLTLFTHEAWRPIEANIVAFLLAAQVNFLLSVTFTWRDRGAGDTLFRRWMLFHGSIALMALVNIAVFAAARPFLPVTLASLAGIAAGAVGNFILGDRLVFRQRAALTLDDTQSAA